MKSDVTFSGCSNSIGHGLEGAGGSGSAMTIQQCTLKVRMYHPYLDYH